MKLTERRFGFLAPAAIATALFGLMAMTSEPTPAPHQGAPDNLYIGAAKCKNCHKSDDSGNQWASWEARGHSKAFERLASPEAKEVAAKHGIANPQEAPECLKCHVTGFGLPEDHFKKGFKQDGGVGCETCHGPGDNHVKARMKVAAAGGATEEYVKLPEGEIRATPTEAECRSCHNPENPTFKPFCYPKRLELVRHWNPKKPRTEEEKNAVPKCTCDGCPETCQDGCGK